MRSRLPVLRHKRRYLVFLLECEGNPSQQDLISEIHESQASLLGDVGTCQNRIRLISFNGRYGILRINHCRTMEIGAVLSTVYSVAGFRAALRILGLSGTIKAATEKYIPQMSEIAAEKDNGRIELGEVSGTVARRSGHEIDLTPDDSRLTKGSDTRYLGLTSFDLSGGCCDADGTSDGL